MCQIQLLSNISKKLCHQRSLKNLNSTLCILHTQCYWQQLWSLEIKILPWVNTYSETEQEAIKKSIVELMEMYKDETESPEPVVKCPKKSTALDKLLGELTTVAELSFSLELDKYLAELVPPRRDNPLVWLKLNASRFKFVSNVTRRLLCMPATTTSSERVFCAAGLTVTKLRSALKPQNVNALIFLNKNFGRLSL